jgi:phage anti-repressor protein
MKGKRIRSRRIKKVDRCYTDRDDLHMVRARDVYKELGVKTRFTAWFNRQVKRYGFVENDDFFPMLTESTGGRRATDYFISTGMVEKLKVLREPAKLEKAWNTPDAVVQRALQIASVNANVGIYGKASRALRRAEKALLREMPGHGGRIKSGIYIAPAAMAYRSAVNDMLIVCDRIVIKYESTQHALGVVQEHYGLSNEAVKNLVFGLREKMPYKAWSAIRGLYERDDVPESGNGRSTA